ncbi:MAG: serine hydrolase [Lachnospiraceae bacterium]|nr:serine hydrolase [Lachnospiraceae bacterium]
MILIFDYFETLIHTRSMNFDRGLKVFWEQHYRDLCSFEEMKRCGDEMFTLLLEYHKKGLEFPFVKEELPVYAERFGGEPVSMTFKEEADFLMNCSDFEPMPGLAEFLEACRKMHIPLYVLSNSGFRAEALTEILRRFDLAGYFENLWSSADFGRIKPCRDFFELAVNSALADHPGEHRSDICYIGDTFETDILGAHKAGIRSLWKCVFGDGSEKHIFQDERASMDGAGKMLYLEGTIFPRTGEPMKKIEIFGDNYFGNYTRTRAGCRAVIIRDGKMLTTYETNTDVWMIPGGGLEEGETLEECVIREVAEETGLVIRPTGCVLEIDEFYEDVKYEDYYYFGEIVGETELHLTPQEAEAGQISRWMPVEEIRELFSRHNEYADTDEMKRGLYQREFTAMNELLPKVRMGETKEDSGSGNGKPSDENGASKKNEAVNERDSSNPLRNFTNRTEGFNRFTEDIVKNSLNVFGVELYEQGILTHSFGDTEYGLHDIFSATKSILSVAVGMAWDRGLIDLDRCVLDYLPEEYTGKMSPKQQDAFKHLTIHRLLTMSVAGFEFRAEGDNWLDFSLSQELPEPEKPVFNYSNIPAYLVGVALQKAIGQDAADFIAANIFEPLGIKEYSFSRSPEGYFYGASGISLTVHSLSKIGLLLYHEGVFEGRRLLSEAYVKRMTGVRQMNREGGYGYYVWKYRDGFSINGKWGQKCYILPAEGLMITFLSHIEEDTLPLRESMERWLL